MFDSGLDIEEMHESIFVLHVAEHFLCLVALDFVLHDDHCDVGGFVVQVLKVLERFGYRGGEVNCILFY